jgi:hypothetical protein
MCGEKGEEAGEREGREEGERREAVNSMYKQKAGIVKKEK